jgi:hypothetical protein
MDAYQEDSEDIQSLLLLINQINPENFSEKEPKLRSLMFGNQKTKDEPGFEFIDSNLKINQVKLKTAANAIFRKAQTEHARTSFYTGVCTSIIRLDL